MSAMLLDKPPAFGTSIEALNLKDEPVLREWVGKLRQRSPYFAHEETPQRWIGLKVGGVLLAAIAHVRYPNGTILISAIVCAPRQAGRVAVNELWSVLRDQWKGRRIVFFVGLENRKMLKSLPIGSKAQAVMFEVTA